MRDENRFKLHFGPYRTPRFHYGAVVSDEWRGEVTIVGISAGRIPWPIGAINGHRSLVVYRGLAKAIRRESIIAVAHWWGIATQTVTKWRSELGITGTEPEGTRRLRREYTKEDWFREAQNKAVAKARDPTRRAKIAAAKRGKKRPKALGDAVREANLGRRASKETRRKMSAAHKRRGTRPPWLNAPWTPEEDELVRSLPAAEVVPRTGRTLQAVQSRRSKLRLPDARRRENKSR